MGISAYCPSLSPSLEDTVVWDKLVGCMERLSQTDLVGDSPSAIVTREQWEKIRQLLKIHSYWFPRR